MWPSWLKGLMGAWVVYDSKKRKGIELFWAFIVLIFGPSFIPIYLARRPLLRGEIRRGSFLWNVICNFERFFSCLLLLAGFAVLGENIEESFENRDLAVAKRAEIQAGSIFGLFVLFLIFLLERLLSSLFRGWMESDMPQEK
ncbi:hypothetical protein HYY75_09545 [bacterium]|nr:hypothetical protein [bacterium]